MMHTLKSLLRDETGATALEYGLIVSLVIIAMLGALNAVAGTTVGMWNNVSTKIGAIG